MILDFRRNYEIYIPRYSTFKCAISAYASLQPGGRSAKGSELLFDDKKIAVGSKEGLAVYLNGTDLPYETYKNCDVNYVIDKIEELLQNTGCLCSYWEGGKETALYFYGESFTSMLEKIQPFLNDYPLCQKCRVEQIA